MWKHYYKIFFRNFFKAKFYNSISILGLAVGLCFAFLTGNYLLQEASVNASLRNLENQYLVKSKWKDKDRGMDFTTFGPFAEALKAANPDKIANYYRFDAITSVVVVGDKEFREEVQVGDASVISMYGLPLRYGDPLRAFQEPNSMVIPIETAIKFFGREDVVGETVLLENFNYEREVFVITAVLDEVPKNTVLHRFANESPPILLPPKSVGRGDFDSWNNQYIVNYVELMSGVHPEELESSINHLLQTHLPEVTKGQVEVYLEPLYASYFNADDGLVKKSLWIAALAAVFILLMAVVNFVNLSVGNASVRIREIGVRKVMGVGQTRLFGQFMAESMLLSFFSMLLALVLYEFSRGYFNGIFGVNLQAAWEWSAQFIMTAVVFVFFVGLLAGIYPSHVLSRLPMVDSLKGKLKSPRENVLLRRTLITFQMVISLLVLGSAIIIFSQVDYFFNKDLGYTKDEMVSVVLPREWNEKGMQKMETFREEIISLPGVKNASLSYELPNGSAGFSNSIYREAGGIKEDAIPVKTLQIDEHFSNTYQLEVLAGQFFHGEAGSFRAGRIVLNESAVRALGYKEAEEAIGEKIVLTGNEIPVEIAGVVRDFHFEALHEAIRPLAFSHIRNTNTYRYLSVGIEPEQLPELLDGLENAFHQAFPGAVFEFEMMGDTLKRLYQAEIRLKKSATAATFIALVIVVIGMLGVVSLNLSKRIKELGIRKLLGATVGEIVYLFLKEYLVICLIASLLSFPLISALMSKWLADFAYRIDIEWWMFALAGVVAVAIALLTVGFQAIRAAVANPVESLRSE